MHKKPTVVESFFFDEPTDENCLSEFDILEAQKEIARKIVKERQMEAARYVIDLK